MFVTFVILGELVRLRVFAGSLAEFNVRASPFPCKTLGSHPLSVLFLFVKFTRVPIQESSIIGLVRT